MSDNRQRPEVLNSLGSAQMSELENRAMENDRQGFMRVAQSYGWDDQTCSAVWNHLSHRASEAEANQAFGNQGQGQQAGDNLH